jgi:hypothetical protein
MRVFVLGCRERVFPFGVSERGSSDESFRFGASGENWHTMTGSGDPVGRRKGRRRGCVRDIRGIRGGSSFLNKCGFIGREGGKVGGRNKLKRMRG